MHRILPLIILLAPAVYASDGNYDYAHVINAEPITVSKRIPVQREVCLKPAKIAPPGDARRDQPTATIAELIRADNRQRQPDCSTVTEYEQQEKTVGWRVTYRYAGTDYVRRMKDKPGQRIRVRVDRNAG